MMVAGGAAPSPFSKSFDAMRIPRIQAVEKDLAYWLKHFDSNPSDRFVSDGDPSTITIPSTQRSKLKSPLPKDTKVVER